MISYRLELEGNDLPTPKQVVPLPPGPRLQLTFQAPPPAEVELFMAGMTDEPCGIELAEESLQAFQCPGGHWMIAMNHALGTGNAVQLVTQRKMLLGVAAAKRNEDNRYSPSYYLFSTPDAAQRMVILTITRVSGELAWAGTAKMTAPEKMKFSLRTAGRVGITPIEIEGVLSRDGKVEFKEGVTSGRVIGKRFAQRLTPPPVG